MILVLIGLLVMAFLHMVSVFGMIKAILILVFSVAISVGVYCVQN